MSENAPDPKRQKVPLADLIAIAERELGMRYRVYPGRVKAGKMTQDAADFEIGGMRAIRDILRLFAEHEAAVRATLEHEMHCRRMAAEAETLRNHPAVDAVLDAFPEAEITDIRETQETAA